MARRRNTRARPDRNLAAEWLFPVAASLVVGCGHFLDGAGRTDLVLLLVMLEALLLAGLTALSGRARERLASPWSLLAPALLMLAVLGAAGLSLSPAAPFDKKPIWAAVGLASRPAVDTGGVLVEMIKLGGLAAVFLAGFAATGSQNLALRTLRALALSTGLYAAYSFVAFAADPLLRGARLMAGFGSANTAATLFGVSVLLSIACLRSTAIANGSWRRNPDLLAWVSLLFSVAALLLTGSRAGATSTLAALVILGVLELVRRGGRVSARGAAGVLAGAAAIAALAAYSTRALLPRLDQISEDREVRVTMVTAHWHAFEHFPMLGYGLGAFRYVNGAIMTPENLPALFDIGATHNVYVQWLEEAGLLGSVPMFALVGLILVVVLWSGLTSDSSTALWQRTIGCCLILTLMHGWTDFALQVPSFSAVLTLALGVGYGLTGARRRRREAQAKPEREEPSSFVAPPDRSASRSGAGRRRRSAAA